MRKLLLATAAFAAFSCGSASAQPPPPPIWNWTGFYVGANLGYSWGNSDTTGSFFNNGSGVLISSSTNSFSLNGVIGGGQVGYNWQNGMWVGGIEADIQASGQNGSTAFTCSLTGCLPTARVPIVDSATVAFNQSLDWFGTVRGRLGVTVTPTVLLYVTGGLAYGGISMDGTLAGFNGNGAAVSTNFSKSFTKAGWVVGAGLEAWLGGNWTGKIEYLYIDLGTISGSATLLTSSPALLFIYSSRITDNILRVGLNLKL
jgi:outer membrane immunogenic protein